VRVLCPDCKTPRPANASEAAFLNQTTATVYDANGCEACQNTGYRGRTGIYELVVVDDTMRQLIHDRASEQELTGYARRKAPSIRDDAVAKILQGVTTVQEVLKVTLEE
jgi:general secretion pathway protein E